MKFAETDWLADIEVDCSELPPATPEIEQERRVAVYDLLKSNAFALQPRAGRVPVPGPYGLLLAVRNGRLAFEVSGDSGAAAEFHLSMTPFARVMKDYFAICASYFDAVKRLPPDRIEAIDMGRRGIHDEGARLLMERLEGKASMDMATARRLFTLVCALRPDG